MSDLGAEHIAVSKIVSEARANKRYCDVGPPLIATYWIYHLMYSIHRNLLTTSPRANITTLIGHFNNFPLGLCHKNIPLKPEFQQNIRRKARV